MIENTTLYFIAAFITACIVALIFMRMYKKSKSYWGLALSIAYILYAIGCLYVLIFQLNLLCYLL